MPLVNLRAGTPDTSGLDKIAAVLNDLNRRREEARRRAGIGSFASSLFEQPMTEAESLFVQSAPEYAAQVGLSRERSRDVKERERLRLEAIDRRERTARVEREAAAEAASRRSVQGQKDVAAYKAELKGTTRKGPTQSQLDRRARATDIGQTLAPLAATDPTVATMLDLAKAIRRGEDRLPEYRAAVEAALGPKLRRRAELQMKAKNFELAPGEDQELLDLGRIDEGMLRDALRYGETVAGRRAGRGGGASQVPSVGATGGSRPQAATSPGPEIVPGAGPSGEMSRPELQMTQEEALGPPVAGPPDRFDEIAFDIQDSGADLSGILSGLQRRDPQVLDALGIDERDADALYQRLGDHVMAGQEPQVQEQAAQTREMPRTKLGALFGAGASIGNVAKSALGELGSRVRKVHGGTLMEKPGPLDLSQDRAMGELAAQAVRQGVGETVGAYGQASGARNAAVGRGVVQGGEMSVEALLNLLAFPAQAGTTAFEALNRVAQTEPQLAAAPGMAQRSMARALGPAEAGAARFEQNVSDLFAQPGQAMQAEPGRNVFGQPAGPGSLFSGPNALPDDEVAAIQDFLTKEEQRRRIEKLLRMMELLPQ